MIDITKPVRTRDGTPVEIISDKGREPYTLVGYIGNGRELDEWAADGAYLPGTKSNNDLENYKPEPQPDADSWIPHIPGDPMPCDGDLVVSVKLRNGEIRPKPLKAKEWVWEAWGELARSPAEIIAWRPHKRPLPQLQPEEWAEEKAAFAAGKKIQYRSDNDPIWTDTKTPIWFSKAGNNFNPQYRIKPEPQWVPLEPKDVPPGSVIRGSSWQSRWLNCFIAVLETSPDGVYVNRFNECITYARLASDWQIKRPNQDWQPCKKEAAQ
jgi:hypothetical protein